MFESWYIMNCVLMKHNGFYWVQNAIGQSEFWLLKSFENETHILMFSVGDVHLTGHVDMITMENKMSLIR